MTAIKLKTSELPKLLPWLEPHFPDTFKVQRVLKFHLMGKFPDLDFIVDQWPHPKAVIAVVDPKSQQLECVRAFDDSVVGLFGVNTESLASVLKAAYTRFTDWSQPKLCRAVAASLLPMLRPLMVKDFELHSDPSLVLKATPSDLTPLPVPDGMKISSVTDATVGIVNSSWKFADTHSESCFRCFLPHFPSVVLTTTSGEHVGHMLGMSDGTMGALCVMPRYRRRGYARVIITQLAQKFFNDGEDAYVMVEESNASSMNLHLSLGFRALSGLKVYYFACHSPKW